MYCVVCIQAHVLKSEDNSYGVGSPSTFMWVPGIELIIIRIVRQAPLPNELSCQSEFPFFMDNKFVITIYG